MKALNTTEMQNVNAGATWRAKCGARFTDKFVKVLWWKVKTYDGRKVRDAHQRMCAACRRGVRVW